MTIVNEHLASIDMMYVMHDNLWLVALFIKRNYHYNIVAPKIPNHTVWTLTITTD